MTLMVGVYGKLPRRERVRRVIRAITITSPAAGEHWFSTGPHSIQWTGFFDLNPFAIFLIQSSKNYSGTITLDSKSPVLLLFDEDIDFPAKSNPTGNGSYDFSTTSLPLG